MARPSAYTGLLMAILIYSCWLISLFFLLNWKFSWAQPLVYMALLWQTHLYTGLFITAHDAMHGTVHPQKKINNLVGWICTLSYALFPFSQLYDKHHQHHRHVHTEADPDHHNGGFWSWYFKFMREYLRWYQLLGMALLFNLLMIWFPQKNLLLFWVLPSLLSTLQLFYFGTWLPHHGEHQNVHHSRSQRPNHVLAFISCYFFGYHYEHHDSPGTPWWLLWKKKDASVKGN